MTHPIPAAALDDRLGFIGTSGSGKTYAAGGAVERLLASGARCVIVDPLDVWWGLRILPDGKTPSPFNVVIFGGAHGDLPLNEHAGKLIGETVAGMAESCIVSLGDLGTKSAERRFMLAFLDAIYRKADPTKSGPFHIVFDEADLWAPQKASEPMLQSRMEEIVRRGRVRGFLPWLITQRPAVLSKDVLSQMDGLVALKLTASQDRDALGAWIEGAADRAEGRAILAALPAMTPGRGIVWIPARGILETTDFPRKVTFDSSRAPKRGEVRRKATLGALDLGALKERLATVEAETKANDPRILKAEIARLTKELAKAPAGGLSPADLDRVEKSAERAGYDRGLAEGERRGELRGHQAGQAVALARARSALEALHVDEPSNETAKSYATSPGAPRTAAPVAPPKDTGQPRPASVAPAPAPRPRGLNGSGVTGPEKRILDAVAWWAAFGMGEPTNEQIAFIAGYSPISSGFTNLKGSLRSKGLIEYPIPGRARLTEAGDALADRPLEEPNGNLLRTRVLDKIDRPRQRVLTPLLAAYPEALDHEALAEASGYSASSSGFTNIRGSLRTLGCVEYPEPGKTRAADWMFP